MSHHCHAHGCKRKVPPRMFVCASHWRELPKPLQQAIWREYREGQEVTKTPTVRYLAVQRRAVGYLAFEPNDEKSARAAAPYILEAELWRRKCIQDGAGDPLDGLPGGPLGRPQDHVLWQRSDEDIWTTINAIRAEAQALGELP